MTVRLEALCPSSMPLDALLRGERCCDPPHPADRVDTHHLLHRQRINRMRPGAFVVNTGRGSTSRYRRSSPGPGERTARRGGVGCPRGRGGSLLQRPQGSVQSITGSCRGADKSCRMSLITPRTPLTTLITPWATSSRTLWSIVLPFSGKKTGMDRLRVAVNLWGVFRRASGLGQIRTRDR